MNIPLVNKEGKTTGTVSLPAQFSESVRPDLIKRAVEAIWANTRQPYGNDPRAGKRASAKLSRRRRNYRGAYGHGISRVPRKIMTRNGTNMNWTAAFAPCVVGGRRAHPPKATKQWKHDLNTQERRKALRSALAASMQAGLVTARGHKLPSQYPIALTTEVEQIIKSKDVHELLMKLGFEQELIRAAEKNIRSGKGKNRSRPYKKRKGPLFVVGANCSLTRAAKNIPGVDVVSVKQLNTQVLAPGATPGRLTLFTEKALNTLGTEKLFT